MMQSYDFFEISNACSFDICKPRSNSLLLSSIYGAPKYAVSNHWCAAPEMCAIKFAMLLLSGVGDHMISSSDNCSITLRVHFWSALYLISRWSITILELSKTLTSHILQINNNKQVFVCKERKNTPSLIRYGHINLNGNCANLPLWRIVFLLNTLVSLGFERFSFVPDKQGMEQGCRRCPVFKHREILREANV